MTVRNAFTSALDNNIIFFAEHQGTAAVAGDILDCKFCQSRSSSTNKKTEIGQREPILLFD